MNIKSILILLLFLQINLDAKCTSLNISRPLSFSFNSDFINEIENLELIFFTGKNDSQIAMYEEIFNLHWKGDFRIVQDPGQIKAEHKSSNKDKCFLSIISVQPGPISQTDRIDYPTDFGSGTPYLVL